MLQQIDEQLALAEKASPGPWTVFGTHETEVLTAPNPPYEEPLVIVDTRFFEKMTNPREKEDAAFIAASRTGWPTALRCFKTAIEGLLDSDESTLRHHALTILCDQWRAGQCCAAIKTIPAPSSRKESALPHARAQSKDHPCQHL